MNFGVLVITSVLHGKNLDRVEVSNEIPEQLAKRDFEKAPLVLCTCMAREMKKFIQQHLNSLE